MTESSPSTLQRPGVILALITLPVFIGALDLTIVSAVLPDVIADLRIPFQTGADEASWVISGYLLAYTISVAFMGRISDLIGRRRTYFIALLIFIAGSWLVAIAAYAPTDWMRSLIRLIQGGRPDRAYMALYALIGGRVIQALGAGAMVPVSMALVADLFPAGKRAVALGIVGAVDTAGWVLGSLYGGVMVQIIDWPVLFWLNIPITTLVAYITWQQLAPVAETNEEGGLNRIALILVLVSLLIVNLLSLLEIINGFAPGTLESLSQSLLNLDLLSVIIALALLAALVWTILAAPRKADMPGIDWPGTLLITLSLFALTLGLGGGGEVTGSETLSEGVTLTTTNIIWLVIAVVSLIAFIVVERRSSHPLFALSHFRERNVSLAATINLFVGFCLMLGLVSVPLFINSVVATDLAEGALLSGLLLGTLTIPMALASIPGGLLTRQFGYRITTAAGMLLAAIGFYLGTSWFPDMQLTTMGLHMGLAGIGFGLTVAPISTSIINAVQSDERGVASALVIIVRLIGMTFGTAIMTNYGLTRSTRMTEQMVAELGTGADFDALLEIARQVATTVINEMLLIAAIICVIAIIPALFLRTRDRVPAD